MSALAFQTTSATSGASGRIAPTKSTHDPIQLHVEAHNALAMAVYYLRQPQANVPGAARKAVQALAALRRMDAAILSTSMQGGAQ